MELRARSDAMRWVALTRSASVDSANHSCCAPCACGCSSCWRASTASCSSTAVSSVAVTVSTCSASISAARSASAYFARKRTTWSPASLSFASRNSACTAAPRLAASAWRAKGLSCLPSSSVRSVRRSRFACMPVSLRCAFSLRRRCLSTPAASSMNARRSSGRESRISESLPWPTMMCISRPMPESDSSSWMSIRRALEPLISYSLAPSRNMRRVMATSV